MQFSTLSRAVALTAAMALGLAAPAYAVTTAKPAAHKTAAKPTAAKPSAAKPTTAKLAPAKVAAKPVAAKPAAKPAAAKLAVAHAPSKPAAQGRMVRARLANGQMVTYNCSLPGNQTKQACKR